MDRKTILAMILIAIVIITIPYYQRYILGYKPLPEELPDSGKQVTDSTEYIKRVPKPEPIRQLEEPVLSNEDKSGETKPVLQVIGAENEETITIVSDKIEVVISNRGGGSLQKYVLKNYEKYDSTLVNMIDPSMENDLYLAFQTPDGNYLDPSDLLFKSNINLKTIDLRDKRPSVTIEYSLKIRDGELKKRYTFYDNMYHFDLQIVFTKPDEILLNRQYQLGWKNGLPSTESYVSDDYTYSQVYVYMGDELESYEIKDEGQKELTNLTGTASWLAIRMKYFIIGISNISAEVSEGVYFSGRGIKITDYIQRQYDAGYYITYSGEAESDNVRFYIGPLDHKELDAYDNNMDLLIMNNGWYERVFRPFSRYLILPVLEFLHAFIPNYGIVIIIFSILIKIAVYPLTKKSYKSMKEMQVIQPIMAEIREKYKSDPQRMNKEMMSLYKEHGVNPFGGCVPMLLQMPLLIALFIVFRSTIQLRGESFIPGWITDLSQTDTLFTLPFSLPMYGNEFNLLPILMAVTMIFQSKMTMQDPKQKAMVYMMPVFMLLIFNRFPSGLNLYYTMFNIWTIIQQKFINKGIDTQKVPVPPKKISTKKK